MTKEQAIEKCKKIIQQNKEIVKQARLSKDINAIELTANCDDESIAIETVLNMLKEKDKEIEYLKENVDYQTLCDFLISSVVADEEPVWTEEHIEELLENFEVRWKNAYK